MCGCKNIKSVMKHSEFPKKIDRNLGRLSKENNLLEKKLTITPHMASKI